MNNDMRNLSKWLNEEQESPIDRQALARVLAMAEQPAQQEPVEVQMRVGNCYWSKVDRKTPVEQLEKAKQLMRDNPGVYQMRLLYTTPQPPAQPSYKDSTPHLSVGESSFESWFSEYHITNDMIKPKQVARDAYAAGMGDPLVAPPAHPLTQEQIDKGRLAPWGEVLDPFTAGVRFAETRHGITKGGAA